MQHLWNHTLLFLQVGRVLQVVDVPFLAASSVVARQVDRVSGLVDTFQVELEVHGHWEVDHCVSSCVR